MNPLAIRSSTFISEQLRILSLYCFIYLQKSFSIKIICCIVCQFSKEESEQEWKDLEINLCYNIPDVNHFFLPNQWGDCNDLWF